MFLGSRLQRVVSAIVLTVVTLAVVGVVVLATTPLGCGPAKTMHIKLGSAQCVPVASRNTLASPSPFFAPTGQPSQIPTANPNQAPASYYPQPQPATYYPYPDSTSGSFPSFTGAASGPSPAQLAINCRLPIFAGGPGSGGFVMFPGGAFMADPRSAVAVPSPSPSASPPPPQYGYGYQGWFGSTYDRAYSRWLPVPYAWVSPDGARYAHPGTPDGIYVQNVSNGTQVELGEGSTWQVLAVGATAVYAVKGSTGGLWLLPFAGGVTTITTSGYWQAVHGDSAYGTATSSVPQGAGNTILRLDLTTGTMADYFSRPSQISTVAGFGPGGNPVIYVQGQPFTIWTGTGAGITQIADLSGSNFYPNGPPIADSHGLWLAGGNGIALYVDGQGWYWMSNLGGQLAGGCY